MSVNMNETQQSSRRRFCIGGLSAIALMASSTVDAADSGEPLNKPSGKKVWLDMDQQELDKAYTQSAYAPNMKTVLKRYLANSEIARQRLGNPKRLSYGSSDHEKLNLFSAAQANASIHIFIHGGAWKSGAAKQYDFLAETFVRHGAHFIAPDFINVKETGGNLMPMVEQVRNCVAWVHKNATSFGGDPKRIFISGHSSGGHLGGVLVTTDWEKDFGLPSDIIKGAVLASGLYDLKPVRLSIRRGYIKFTDEIEQQLSPQRHLDKLTTPLVLAHGTLETPEFMRQTEDFAAAIKKAGKSVELYRGDQYNHFELLETLANPLGIVGTPTLKQMGLYRI